MSTLRIISARSQPDDGYTLEQIKRQCYHGRWKDILKFVVGQKGEVFELLFDPFNNMAHADLAERIQEKGYSVLGGGKIDMALLEEDDPTVTWGSHTLVMSLGYDRPGGDAEAGELLEWIRSHFSSAR